MLDDARDGRGATRPHSWLVSVPLFLLASCLSSGSGPSKGKLEKNTYHSPHGNYSMPIPMDSGFGRRIQDDARDVSGKEGYVSISNDFGALCSVEYAQIPAAASAHFEGTALPESLRTFYRDGVVGMRSQSFPGIRSLHDEALAGAPGPAHFGIVFIPDGSTLVRGNMLGLPTDDRNDTVRAFLVFTQDGFLYTLGCASSQDATEPELTLTPERLEGYKHTLGEMRASMRFAPAR